MKKSILSLCVMTMIGLVGCSKEQHAGDVNNSNVQNNNQVVQQQSQPVNGGQAPQGVGAAIASQQIPMVAPPTQEQVQQAFQNAPGVPSQADMERSEVKAWLVDYLKNYQLELDWKLQGNYAMTKFELSNLKHVPPGQAGVVLAQMMTLTNVEKIVLAKAQNSPVMPINHPAGVFVLACGKKLMFVEMNSPQEFDAKLKSGGFSGCTQVDPMLGTQVNQPSGPLPPFAQPQGPQTVAPATPLKQ